MEHIHTYLKNANDALNLIITDTSTIFDEAVKENAKKNIEMNNSVVQKFNAVSHDVKNEIQKIKHHLETTINKTPEIKAHAYYDKLYKNISSALIYIMSLDLDPKLPTLLQPKKGGCNCRKKK